MDNWQAWAAAGFGIMLSMLTFNHRREKTNADKRVEDFYKHKLEVMERITRIESEIMTEREVREVLQEFLLPFMSSLQKIDNKTDNIQKDITALKVHLASIPKRRQDNE
tara:strand:- start:2008 stop:2334 length:327 start_codon:yes stop_codon:yes gene_type:complete